VEAAKIKNDPEISWLLEQPALNVWIGEDRHVMTYSIAAGESFNMVLSHVDTSDPSTWKPENAVKDIQRLGSATYQDYCHDRQDNQMASAQRKATSAMGGA
jgi:hypothetical protein